MTLKLAAAVAMAAADAAVATIDAGTPASTLVIYNNAEPAAITTAITDQTALVTFELPDPAFGASVDGAGGATATANAIASVTASASGTASWFRIIDGNGVAKMQGSVTDTTGNGDLKVSSTAIVSGIEVSVISLTATMPK